MEEEASSKMRSTRWEEFQEKAKDDPELAEHLKVAAEVIRRYNDTFRQLADC